MPRMSQADVDYLWNHPMAAPGLTSYRYRGPYGYIMIGAVSFPDAMEQAALSTTNPAPDRLEIWNGTSYEPVMQPCAHCAPDPIRFTIHTLPNDLRERAIEHEQDNAMHDDWAEYCVEDYETILNALGFGLDYNSVKLMDGTTRAKPIIHYQVSHCQSDGAAFSSYWYPTADPLAILTSVMSHAPQDETLHSIAFDLALLTENAKPFYETFDLFAARISIGARGLSNLVCVDRPELDRLDVDDMPEFQFLAIRTTITALGLDNIESELQSIVDRLNDWFCEQLTNEIDHLTSEETILETLAQYEFDEDGYII